MEILAHTLSFSVLFEGTAEVVKVAGVWVTLRPCVACIFYSVSKVGICPTRTTAFRLASSPRLHPFPEHC